MKKVLIISFFAVVILYSLFQARFIILGPHVKIISPKNGEVVASPVVEFEGLANNIAWISLNDRQIYVDEGGYWSEKLIVSKGVSIMTVHARDRFGRETEKSIQVVLN